MKELYRANDKFMFRIPTAQESKIQYTKEEVLEVCTDKAFREKIEIASPSLLEMMDLYMNDSDKLSQKKKDDFFNSVMKYYIRSKERPTPFGLFSAVGVGQFDKEEQLDNRQLYFQKKIHVDAGWMFEYIAWLEKKYYRQLKFKVNNACYRNGNRVVLMYSTEKDIDEMSVRFTKVFEIVEYVCREYRNYEDIYREISVSYPEVEEDIINNYLQELIQKQILISSLRPPFTSRNQLEYLKQQCETAGLMESAVALGKIHNFCQEYENTIIGEGIDKYRKIVDYMKNVYKSKYYLQVDSIISGSSIKLSDSMKRSVEHLATFLVTMSSISRKRYAYLEQYRTTFLEKYGFQREVPILEMLDTVVGIGAPTGYMFPANDFFEEPVQEGDIPASTRNYFMSKYEAALQHKTAIHLDMESIQKILEIPEVENAPLSFEMYFQLRDVDGEKQLHLGANGGSMCAGKTFGRFSAESIELEDTLLQLNKKERDMRPENTETCEISYLPMDSRSGNVVRCITGREKYLTAYTNPEEEDNEIRLEDILIGATETQFYAKNRKTGKYIVFGSNNMYNIMLQPNAFRFLLEIANDGKITWCDYPWRYLYLSCRHIPQIEFEGIVLSNEQWFINRADLGLSIKEKKFQEFKHVLLDYIKKEEIPEKICLVEEDNRIPLDLKSELAVRILFDEFKKKGDDSVLLERIEEGKAPVYQNGEARPTEIVVPVFRKQKDVFDMQNTKQEVVSREQHIVFPYENWLYLKLYCKKEREEELVAFQLNDFGNKLKQELGIEHFFMRYMDPKPHIRLRFYGNPQMLLQATPSIIEWAKDMERQKIIGDLTISIYEKEIERYGGPKLIELAEELFRLDSVIVEEILCRKRLKQLDMEEIEIAIASVLKYVDQFYDGFQERLAFLTRNYHSSTFMNDFKEKKNKLLELFDLETDWNYFNSREDRRLLMTLLEQRNQLIDKYKKQIVEENPDRDFKNNIVNSILHLHCNRLLGTNRELERKVMSFVESIMYAKKYRLMKEDSVERHGY